MHTDNYVEVDCRALEVDGLASLDCLRLDGVIHLHQPALGIAAGHWRAGAWQREHGRPSASRILEPITDAEAAAYADRGYTVHQARVAPNWVEPRPRELIGFRLGDLRRQLAALCEMPDDALVVISPADHPDESRWSPAALYVSTGLYAPDTSGGGNYGRMYDAEPDDEEDRAPEGAVPAVVLHPSN
ncbi:hypothetical protein ABR737_01605 [Streptomyces sp. Edi2]|uniref:hypothetical protein n=1 Tax=Streptomyces sp. Edi2 TaxID=3162528 RepID=UPI0033062725